MTVRMPDDPLGEALLALTTGTWVSQAIGVAARLGVADALARGPRTAADAAASLDADPPALHRLLRALADVGLLKDDGDGRFALTPLGDLLRTEAPGSLRGWAEMLGSAFHRSAWSALETSVRTGEPAFPRAHGRGLYDHLRDRPSDRAVFGAAMVSVTGRFLAPAVAACDFAPASTVVDVGGGRGAVVAAVLDAHPGVRGVLFDMPQVIAAAPAGLAGRCRLVSGDFFRSVPEGGDTYLLCNVLLDWDDDRAARVLGNCRRAMNPGGRVLIGEAVPVGEADRSDRPTPAPWIDLEMLVMTDGGRQRTRPEYERLLDRAGLRLTGVPARGAAFAVLEARPADRPVED
ncbi:MULTISPECIES: methyltransferase [Actinomadura]|uniref:methyltransferase n=1 Tax=Actinomadura TaxID=1988 RepID=UPI0003FAF289|nr:MULTISPECIES: methyltransferase [Actinomadura]RSN62429.1 methyltransferase [Actinomadura sp. WAC 06369]